MSAVVYNIPYYQVNSPIVMNQSFTLGWVPVYFKGYFIQIVWTGTPNGFFQLNASGDAFSVGTDIIPPCGAPYFVWPQMKNPVRSNIIGQSQYQVMTSGANAWNVTGAQYNFVQLSYVDQSGGSSTATLNFCNVLQKGP